MYEKTAKFYDTIYGFKDYAGEAEKLRALISQTNPAAASLLDVACGSGKHLEHFKQWYDCAGLDYEPDFVRIAQERHPDLTIYQGDFRNFELGQAYDAVTCLFSAIGYADTSEGLDQAIASMAKHLKPAGVLLVESWFGPDHFKPGHVHMHTVDTPDLKIARTNNSRIENGRSVMDMHHLIGTPEEVYHFMETHAMGLFTHEQYLDAFRKAGLKVDHDPEGLIGRTLYIGLKA